MADQGEEGLLSPFLRARRIAIAKPFIKGRILDVGCGSGALAEEIPSNRYIGVEIDDASLATARSQHPQHCFQSFLPPAQPDFDTVVALAVIEHQSDPLAFLSNLSLRLCTSPKSYIVCTTPHPRAEWVHSIGASLGFFSKSAKEQHNNFFDHAQIEILGQQCGLSLVVYRRFLLGFNQIAIFSKFRDSR